MVNAYQLGEGIRQVVPVTNRTIIEKLPFYVNKLGYFDCGSDYFTRREGHPECLLLYTIQGRGVIEYQGVHAEFPENCAAVIDCRRYQLYRSEGDRWEFYWIHFDGQCAISFTDLLNHDGLEIIRLGRSLDFPACFLEMRRLVEAGGWEMELSLSNAMHQLLTTLISLQHRQLAMERYQTRMPDLQRVLRLLHSHFAEELTVDWMAAEARMSRYHFIRCFQEVVGESPYHYLTLYRINQAKKLLADTDLTVQEIALQVGFSNAKNFIAAFKKHAFATPSQYRRQLPG